MPNPDAKMFPHLLARRLATKTRSALGRLRRRILAASEGGALVETALTMPIIFLIMTGIFSFSIVLYQKLQLAQAVGVGGNFLAVDRGDNNPCSATAAKIAAAAPGLTASKINLTFVLNGVSTSGTGASTSCAGSSGQANANMIAGGSAEVEATYACTLQVYGMSFSTCSLSSQITEVVQ